ncbi:hypothetical protein [Paraflavitalea speifideaquila]|uniref:hypothetical protein n=1 Tax=Paraflavitalea speifideaquila TaxID=3076558 RepID=UPI0028E8C684|nr:hypothetical protein [Paraflavitalea speifideiaquila]
MQKLIKQSVLTIVALLLCWQMGTAQTMSGGMGANIGIDDKSKFPFIVQVQKECPLNG